MAMLFMVIERFPPGSVPAIYRRLREEGRSLPDGLSNVNSLIEANLGRCFQLMECDDARLLQEWVLRWNGKIDAEIVPVASSRETQAVVQPFLSPAPGKKGSAMSQPAWYPRQDSNLRPAA